MVASGARCQRPGAALVEFAVVSIVFFLFLFGIIEFAMIVWVNNIVDSAAREGARYAAVHTNEGAALSDNVRAEVMKRLAGVQNRFVSFDPDTNITVTAVDPTSGEQLVDVGNNPIPPEGTGFGQLIQVHITGSYQPLLPGLLRLPSAIPMSGTAVINSESN